MPLKSTAQPLPKKHATFDLGAFLASTGVGQTKGAYKRGEAIFRRGDKANAVYYIENGTVKITVTSEHGKEGLPRSWSGMRSSVKNASPGGRCAWRLQAHSGRRRSSGSTGTA